MQTICTDIKQQLKNNKFYNNEKDPNDVCSRPMLRDDYNIANAGHPRPFIYKSQEDMVMELQPPNDDYVFGPIGINGIEHNYLDYELQMQSGDVLILYTDGLTETMNIHREDFGKSSVQALLQRNNKKSAKDIMNIIMRKLNEHASGATRSDDITAIIIKRK